MKKLILIPLLFLFIAVRGQDEKPLLALNSSNEKFVDSDTNRIRFSGSEDPGFTFIVHPNIKEKTLYIETNYTKKYKIRFIDYYGESAKVYKDVMSDTRIDVRELGKGIFIMNIIDDKSRKVLTSQMLNLKRWGF